ncbi:MAG TPA: sugar transferase, partial [Glaciihabitans sp.]|nr:sugar transferase [Glaciihabitans sp.]
MMIREKAGAAARRSANRVWRHIYAARLVVTDLMALIWVVFGVQIAWLGIDSRLAGASGNRSRLEIGYTLVSLVVIAGWMAALKFYDTRADRVIGLGSAEYKRIADASIRLFGLIAIIAFLFKIDLARGYILIAFPFGMVVLMFSRWIWRQWLGVQRQKGLFSST